MPDENTHRPRFEHDAYSTIQIQINKSYQVIYFEIVIIVVRISMIKMAYVSITHRSHRPITIKMQYILIHFMT